MLVDVLIIPVLVGVAVIAIISTLQSYEVKNDPRMAASLYLAGLARGDEVVTDVAKLMNKGEGVEP